MEHLYVRFQSYALHSRGVPLGCLNTFRLVKSVGRLPNVMYLLVFERELAEKMVQQRYPSEGPQFLEKIIQAGFELPTPLQTDLKDAVHASVQEICGSPNETQIDRVMNTTTTRGRSGAEPTPDS